MSFNSNIYFSKLYDNSFDFNDEGWKELAFKLALESKLIIFFYSLKIGAAKSNTTEKMGSNLQALFGFKSNMIGALINAYKQLAADEVGKSLEDLLKDDFKIYGMARKNALKIEFGKKRKHKLDDLKKIRHKEDIETITALKNLRGIDIIIKKFNELYDGRFLRIDDIAGKVRVSPKQYPSVYYAMKEVCEILDSPVEPHLYLTPGDEPEISTHSMNEPCITINPGIVNRCSRDELLFLLGHELGHIISEHIMYKTLGNFISEIIAKLDKITFGASGILGMGLEYKFYQWMRTSEYTADRYGLMACQNPGAAITSIMKSAGAPPNYLEQIDLNEYLSQYDEYMELDKNGLDKAFKFFSKFSKDTPYNVIRLKYIIDFSKRNFGLD